MGEGFDRGLAETLFREINQNTERGPGITRGSYSQIEGHASMVVSWHAERLGLEIERDFAGNLHVRTPAPKDAPDVAFGSHLDTVPSGGRYDGTAGVVAGLLVLERALREQKRLPHPLRLIVLRGEESAWFGKCYLGSSAMFGLLSSKHLQLKHRTYGISHNFNLHRAMFESGADPQAIGEGRQFDRRLLLRFYELHIEQGPVLEDAQEPLAVVTSIRGNNRYLGCRAIGESGHSGTTPQHMRKDAVLATAEYLSAVETACHAWINRDHDLVFTPPILSTDPATNAISVIPGSTTFSMEFRSVSKDTLSRFDVVCRELAHDIGESRGVTISLGEAVVTDPVTLDTGVIAGLFAHASTMEGIAKVRMMPSGAGHDAAVFQGVGIPTGMIFVRNAHGSHNPREDMRMEDFFLATELLYRAVTEPL